MTRNERNAQTTPLGGKADPHLTLIASVPGQDELRIECRRVVTLLGSREGCKARLRGPKIAPVHVALVNDGTRVIGVDLVTRNGTLLNGLRMECEQLGDGDVLAIHPWEFRVVLEDSNHETKSDVHPMPLDPSPQAVALEHLESGRTLYPNREVCTIGRRSGCDIVIPDKRVSRTHALLINYHGHPAICDLLSRNDTIINDNVVAFHVLKDQDVLTVGDSRFRVRLVGSAVVERAARSKSDSTAPVLLEPEPVADEIDIEQTESAGDWRIADRVSKAG